MFWLSKCSIFFVTQMIKMSNRTNRCFEVCPFFFVVVVIQQKNPRFAWPLFWHLGIYSSSKHKKKYLCWNKENNIPNAEMKTFVNLEKENNDIFYLILNFTFKKKASTICILSTFFFENRKLVKMVNFQKKFQTLK